MNKSQIIIRYSISKKDRLFFHLKAGVWSIILLLFGGLLPIHASINDDKPSQPKYEYMLKINSSAVAVVDSNIVVSLQMTAIQDVPIAQSIILSPELIDTVSLRQIDFPLIFINSRNQQIYFERELKKDYPDAMALRKKNGKDLKIDYLRSAKYEPWMKNAVLKVKKLSCACNRQKDRGENVIPAFEQKVIEEIKLFPVYLVPPADNGQKVREEKGSAYLCFKLNKWDIIPDYMTNPTELQKIYNSVNVVKNDSDVTITRMVIEGYASPEGPNGHNEMLSQKRTQALRDYLQKIGITQGIRLNATGKGENWEGFMDALRNNMIIPQRNTLLRIANSNLSLDEMEKRMKAEAPEGFKYCLETVFPALRCTNYTVIYTVRPFTLEESERVFETRPINLSINEIYRLADKYATNQEKYYSIIRKAYLMYPDDSYINLTMAYLELQKSNAKEAAEYLSKVKDCPEKTMNEGIVAYLNGDLKKAILLIEQANNQGLKEAARQLQEFKKNNK